MRLSLILQYTYKEIWECHGEVVLDDLDDV